MSNLLFDEAPLVVSPTLAGEIGLKEAVVLQQFHYWLQRSNNEREGHKWIYNSYEGWRKQFPFIKSTKTMKTIISHLEDEGLIIASNFNKAKFDKTKWYRIDYSSLDRLGRRWAQNYPTMGPKLPDRSGKNYPTNTRDYPETTTETNKESAASVQPPEIPKDDDPRPPAGYAIEYFEKVWGFPNTQQIQDLTEDVDEYGKELTIAALRLAGSNDVKRGGLIRYIEKVLSDWKAADIETVEQAREEMRQHLSRQNGGYKPKPGVSREHLPDYDAQAASQAPSSDGQSIDDLRKQLAAQKAAVKAGDEDV